MTAVVIGYGSIGARHAAILERRHSRLTVVDGSPEARARAISAFPLATVLDSVQAMDSLEDNALAVIATWGPSHSQLFVDLVDRGARRILCEKPLAHSVHAAAQMCRIAQEQSVALAVHLQRRYNGLAGGLAHLAEEFDLGEPTEIVAVGGARCLVTTGIHYIDLAAQLFGSWPCEVVSSAVGEPINPRSRDLRFYGGTAVWSWDDGRECVMAFSNRSSVLDRVFIVYRDATIELLGAAVRIGRRPRADVDGDPRVTRVGPTSEICYVGPIPGLLISDAPTERALDEITSGEVARATPEVGLLTTGACIGAIAAGRDGIRVELPIEPESELGREEWPIS